MRIAGDDWVPERVRQCALQSGPQARQWLRDLPHLIDELEREWGIRVGPALHGGSAAFVATAQMADGGAAVVKLGMTGGNSDFPREAATLLSAQGNGYAKVLRYDAARHALLLEALGSPMQDLALPPEAIITLLCRMLRQAWQTPPEVGQAFEHKAAGLKELVATLWEELRQPCPRAIVDRALTYADRRSAAFDPSRCVVVHGDPHPANALASLAPRAGAESGFVFVDPDGILEEPEYDLGVVLRDWCPQLLASPDPAGLARRYCRVLAQESQLSEDAIWEWGFLERVSTGLYIAAYGSAELGQPFFETARLLLDG